MRLAALRGDMSVLELSRRSGVARNTIAALERGEGNPTLETLYALADALGVPLADLLVAPAPAVSVVRAGAGARVEGAALEGELLGAVEPPGGPGGGSRARRWRACCSRARGARAGGGTCRRSRSTAGARRGRPGAAWRGGSTW